MALPIEFMSHLSCWRVNVGGHDCRAVTAFRFGAKSAWIQRSPRLVSEALFSSPGQLLGGEEKESRLFKVRQVFIEIDHTPGRGGFRAGGEVTVRVREPVADSETVTCVIPGHHQEGREVIAERLEVADGALDFDLSGRCGYESGFAYSSEEA
jgi:hypothetical protein